MDFSTNIHQNLYPIHPIPNPIPPIPMGFHFRRILPSKNHLLKTQPSFSTFAAKKSFPHIFQECSKVKARDPGRQAHARMIVTAFKPSIYVSNTLLQMYIKCSRLECAVKVFDRMPERDCVTWNTMLFGYSVNGKMVLAQSLFDLTPDKDMISWNSLLSGYLQNGNCLMSLKVFVMMGRDDVTYDETTFSVVLKATANSKDCVFGLQVHGVVVKSGFENDVMTGNTMLSMYAKCQMLEESLRFWDTITVKTSESWSSMIAGHVANGELKGGIELFKEMQREGVTASQSVYASVFKSCAGLSNVRLASQLHGHALKSGFGADTTVGTAILDMYAKCDDFLNASKVFNLLPNHDCITYFIVVNSCSKVGNVGLGKQMHAQIIKQQLQSHVRIINTLVDMYSKCGNVHDSVLMFQKSSNRNLVTWNTMVCAYAHHGYGKEALEVFEKMVVEKVMPDHATFVGVLHACVHSGFVDEALRYLHVMQNEYGLEPKVEHYNCMVDALGRSGRIIDALKLIEDMPLKANYDTWRSLLSNCKIHRNVKVAEIAAKSLVQLDPQASSAYILLSHIYADAGMMEEASNIIGVMRSNGIKTRAGCSWIEASSL